MQAKVENKDLTAITNLLTELYNIKEKVKVERLGGLTNHSYHVINPDGKEWVVRLPGEGTEKMINRQDEKVSTELACRLGIDAKLLYFGDDGVKISEYIANAKTMSPELMREKQQIIKAADVLKKLHSSEVDTGIPFEVFEMAKSYEDIIAENNVSLYEDYSETKENVMQIKNRLDSLVHSKKVPCHNDPLCENWIMGNAGLMLVDWEYAGMNDPLWDVADVSIESDYDEEMDNLFLESYFERQPTALEKQSFYANKIYLDYLWTLWGKTRVPYDGEPMEEYAKERYLRLKDNLNKINQMEESYE